MVQMGFLDADRRLEVLSKKGDPLEAIERLVPWESFRADIEAVAVTPRELRKSNASSSWPAGMAATATARSPSCSDRPAGWSTTCVSNESGNAKG